jgi:hypothetical protein
VDLFFFFFTFTPHIKRASTALVADLRAWVMNAVQTGVWCGLVNTPRSVLVAFVDVNVSTQCLVKDPLDIAPSGDRPRFGRDGFSIPNQRPVDQVLGSVIIGYTNV